ncbi:MAG: M48 family metalloprotease [Verrucomicrobia bacterium]|nr:M48 family metalloprotease [Verrucomicrobiota bacterium]
MQETAMNSIPMTRREFLALSALSGAAVLTGCAINPVTGKKELMFISEADEIRMDSQASPHQFSADYGPLRDSALNAYLEQVGRGLADRSHRPNMPYSFRAVNASHVNAYAFLGGSIATTRGIMLSMDDEAELSALLGHEIGHVNARHAARSMTSSMLVQIGVAAATVAVAEKNEDWAPVVAGLGGIGAGMLLARYSRGHEREADALGMEYMVRSGYNPKGMIGLQDILRKLSHGKPSAIELMFATHPMSEERYQTATKRAATEYAQAADLPVYRERYMDQTARLRKLQGTVDLIQKGDKAVGAKKLDEALGQYRAALQQTPDDYEALLKAAKVCLAMNRTADAQAYAAQAKAVYPEEAQAYHVEAMAATQNRRFDTALADLQHYQRVLPGNPNTLFYTGFVLENMGRKNDAAQQYKTYLQSVNQGGEAQHAANRLTEWGKW